MKEITVYCDGSSIGNPGPGGWGAVVADHARVKEVGGADAHTTNNKMELTAAIEALLTLKSRSKVTIHTDSRYVINGITKWVYGWEKKGWLTLGKTDVLNKELWQALMRVSSKHDVTWEHVKGHSGVLLNERVDQIANGFARGGNVDLYYGSLIKYQQVLENMPKPRTGTTPKKKKNTGKPYSYVSVIDHKVLTHTTWGECEARVKGRNAKFKKVFSKDEESALKKEWGR